MYIHVYLCVILYDKERERESGERGCQATFHTTDQYTWVIDQPFMVGEL